jgi:hypothetical protein
MVMLPKSDFKGRDPGARQSSAVRRSLEATAEFRQVVVRSVLFAACYGRPRLAGAVTRDFSIPKLLRCKLDA